MDRRLPVYIVVDSSESMVGEPISSVTAGISSLMDALRGNPQALETVWLSVMSFSGKAKQLCPLTEIWNFRSPTFGIGPGTSLGKAIDLLCDSIDREIVRSSPTEKGDWKPIVFILTDGQPTDKWTKSADRLKKYSANVIAVGCGSDADLRVLSGITPNVLSMAGTTKDDFARFFKWVSASVSTTSTQLGREGQPISLPEMPEGVSQITEPGGGSSPSSPSQIILAARCMNTKSPYLMRFRLGLDKRTYGPEGSYPVGEDYFAESKGQSGGDIGVDAIVGIPACPHCGNQGAGKCQCGGLLCNPVTPGEMVCPHCGLQISAGGRATGNVRRVVG